MAITGVEPVNTGALLSVTGLTKRFPVGRGLFRKASSFIHAVDDVTFDLEKGGSLGLVGESGCGKTTVGKLLVKLIEPTSGEILFRLPGLADDTGPSERGGLYESPHEAPYQSSHESPCRLGIHRGTPTSRLPEAGPDDFPGPL